MQGGMLLEPRRFESVSVTTLAERIMIGLGGLICLMPAWELFFRYRLDPFQLGYVPFWIITLLAGSMAVCLLGGAILGGTQTITLDGTARTLELRHRYWRRSRNRSWRFEELGALEVTEDNWSDGPPSYRLTIAPKRGKPIALREFSAKADAEELKAALERLMA
ncbi:MAG: hypothetical protein ACRCVA_04440 [Phreatobacter sp.]